VADPTTVFWQTLVAAVNSAQQVLRPNYNIIRSIYMDTDTVAATVGQTINVVIPSDASQNVTDIGTGDAVISDIAFGTTPIVMAHHPMIGYPVRDFQQWNSPENIRKRFLDSALTAIHNYVNNDLGGLFNSTNFATNTPISTTAHIVTTTQALSGLTVLSDKFVPVENNPEDVSLLLPSQPYYAMLGDNQWTEALIAGNRTAEEVRETGRMPHAYGMTPKLDQQLPTTGAVGSRTYTAAILHKYAVCMVTRPIAAPETTVVESLVFDFYGVPVRVMYGYNHQKMAFVVTIDCGYGRAVVRPEMCQLYTIAE
jgi:hypothetical protein